MEILVDYLSFTDKKYDIDFWKKWLGIDTVEFMEGSNKSSYGWQYHLYYHGMHLRYGGREDVGLEFSGTGCRFIEQCNNCDFDWAQLLGFLDDLPGVNVSRLDIAGDDQDGILQMNKLYRHTINHKYICRARRCVWMNGDEQEIIFGSSKSDTRLRIYNKALERGVDGPWIRCEFQLRDDAADSFIKNLRQQPSIGSTYSGVLVNYLRYTSKAPDQNNNNDRLDTASWWRTFTNEAARIKNIKVGGLSYNYEDLREYITVQTASSLKTFVELHDGDLTGLIDIINAAELNERQKLLIKNSSMIRGTEIDRRDRT